MKADITTKTDDAKVYHLISDCEIESLFGHVNLLLLFALPPIYIGHTPAPYAARRERAIDRRTHHMHSSEWFVPATIISKYGKFSPWGSALELLNVSTYPKEIFGGSMPFVLLMHGGHVGIHVTVVIVFLRFGTIKKNRYS